MPIGIPVCVRHKNRLTDYSVIVTLLLDVCTHLLHTYCVQTMRQNQPYYCDRISLGDYAACTNFVGFRGSVPLLPAHPGPQHHLLQHSMLEDSQVSRRCYGVHRVVGGHCGQLRPATQ